MPPESPSSTPMVIGVAGGIGSGKSALSRALGQLGCLVIDFDTQAKAALDLPEVRSAIVQWWGDELLGEDGRIDRARLAQEVFNDEAKRARLEALVHPLVIPNRADLMERARDAGARGVVLDAPLLFEAGVDKLCDVIAFVEVPRETRLQRLKATRGWDADELARRESAQWPLDRKRNLSDVIIENTGGEDELDRWARHILEFKGKQGGPARG